MPREIGGVEALSKRGARMTRFLNLPSASNESFQSHGPRNFHFPLVFT